MSDILSISLAVVASMTLGTLWYSQFAVGPLWMKLVGHKKENVTKTGMALTVASSVVSALLIAWFLRRIPVPFGERLLSAAVVWLIFGESMNIQRALYERRDMRLYAISAAHGLLNLIVITVAVSIW